MVRCFRTADICSAARHASGLPLCACAIAFLMFCVLGLPWQAAYQSITTQENNNRSVIPSEVEESRGTTDSKFAGSFDSASLPSG